MRNEMKKYVIAGAAGVSALALMGGGAIAIDAAANRAPEPCLEALELADERQEHMVAAVSYAVQATELSTEFAYFAAADSLDAGTAELEAVLLSGGEYQELVEECRGEV